MMGIVIGAIILITALGISYLITTGLVWVVCALVEVVFSTSIDYNVWWAGLLVWIVLFMIRNSFGGMIKVNV